MDTARDEFSQLTLESPLPLWRIAAIEPQAEPPTEAEVIEDYRQGLYFSLDQDESQSGADWPTIARLRAAKDHAAVDKLLRESCFSIYFAEVEALSRLQLAMILAFVSSIGGLTLLHRVVWAGVRGDMDGWRLTFLATGCGLAFAMAATEFATSRSIVHRLERDRQKRFAVQRLLLESTLTLRLGDSAPRPADQLDKFAFDLQYSIAPESYFSLHHVRGYPIAAWPAKRELVLIGVLALYVLNPFPLVPRDLAPVLLMLVGCVALYAIGTTIAHWRQESRAARSRARFAAEPELVGAVAERRTAVLAERGVRI